MTIHKRYTETLTALQEAGNFRSFTSSQEGLLDICSNDYLSLNTDEQLYDEFMQQLTAKRTRFSACSSRLLSGNTPEHDELEALIASAFQTEACLLYNSGYHANVGILPALAGKKDLILADKLVHASMIDGIQLAPADFQRYRHLDYAHLETLLQKYRADYEQVFIVTESIFSMDGDIADLHQLVELKNKYNCLLYVDEAHALGVRGKNGLGCVEEMNCIKDVDLIVGTFGKAMASVGAYVACSEILKQYLVNHSRTLIFTTALPPVNNAWTKFLFERLPDFENRRQHLAKLSVDFAASLGQTTASHIVPYIIGENQEAIAASQLLKKNGFNVLPIRYPTVPKGTARLRFSLNAGMKIEQLLPIKDILENR